MMMRTVLTLAASALVVSAACIQVTADRITGREFKAAAGELAFSHGAYEANSKVVKAAGEIYIQVNNLTR